MLIINNIHALVATIFVAFLVVNSCMFLYKLVIQEHTIENN